MFDTHRRRRPSRRSLALALGGLIVVVALTPTGCYLSRGAWEEGKILARRKPIAELVSARAVDALTRRKLQIVLDAREYASDSLRLRAKESFTTFSPLDRDTLVLVLSAAYRDRLEPYTWWFPIVGRVPYKGYFDFEAARRAARDFQRDGYDVSLRPSDAFSTLGWFNDPLLSTSLRRDSVDLVNAVIHELTHNTFYAPSNTEFNESFASFVGSRGAAAFFRSRGQPVAADRVDAGWEDEKQLGDFWTALAHTLDSAYKAHPDSREARVAVRDTVYMRARQMLVSDIGPSLRTVSPLYAQRVPLDNASLLARRVYARNLGLFDSVYVREAANLKRTIGRIIGLAKASPEDPYGALRRWLTAFPLRRSEVYAPKRPLSSARRSRSGAPATTGSLVSRGGAPTVTLSILSRIPRSMKRES